MSLWGLSWFVNRRQNSDGQVSTFSEAGWTPYGINNVAELEALYDSSPVVHACVNEIAQSIASAPLEIGSDAQEGIEEPPVDKVWPSTPPKEPEPKEDVFEAQEDHELLKLFTQNPLYDYQTLIERMVISLMTAGVVYIERKGSTLIPWIASYVQPVEENGLVIKGYKIKTRDVSTDNMIVVGYPSLSRMNAWSSPTSAVYSEIMLCQDIKMFIGQCVNNKDLCGGVVEFDAQFKQEQIERYLQLMAKERVRIGRGAIRVVTGKYTPPPPLEKYDFNALLGQLEATIAANFNIPPIIAGLNVGIQSSTYSNYKEARNSFYEECLKPIWSKLQRAFTYSLLGPDSDIEFRFNTESFKPREAEEVVNPDESKDNDDEDAK